VPPAIRNGALIGRLEIPRLNMRAVVREGAGQDTLDVALGHIPGTALPGQPGNVGVAGHRDTLFRGLRKIEKNDVIEFQTPNGSYNYKVVSTEVVKPDNVAVLDAGRHPEMTLVTCYPFYYVGSAPDRFIVKARLVTEATAPARPVPRSARHT
jgi:sortase A